MTNGSQSGDLVSVDRVESALRSVTDPDLGMDVLDSALVTDVRVEGSEVVLSADTTGLDPAVADDVVEQARGAVLELAGVAGVTVQDGLDDATEEAGDAFQNVDTVVAVASAKGGVGKTTVATHLARAFSEGGLDVGVFDADIYGPNVPRVLDVDGHVRATEDGGALPVDAGDLQVMSVGFLVDDGPLAWRGSMAHEALHDLLSDTVWEDRDVVVVDLPPGTGDVALTMLQSAPIDGVVLVSTPYPTSVEDTNRSAALFEDEGVRVLGGVLNMRGFECPDCGSVHETFGEGDAADRLDVPILAEFPFTPAFQARGQVDAPPSVESLADAMQEELSLDHESKTRTG